MKLRFANSNIVEVVDIRVNNGTLEIDFTSDKRAEEIETLMSNRAAMAKVELLNSTEEPCCYYSNFTEFSGVYSKDTLKRGFAIQPKAEIETRMNEIQAAASTATRTAESAKTLTQTLQSEVQEVAQNNAVTTRCSQLYAQTLSDDQALEVKDIYDTWTALVNKKTFVAENAGFKFTHEGILYKTTKPGVQFQAQWVPGQGTESLYTVINETNAGTKSDPIPYAGNMILERGKFYSQDGVVYECIRDSGIALHNALKDLVGNYVQVAK